MRAERHKTVLPAGTNAKHIADLVDLHVDEAELAKAVGQPHAACGLAKRRRGYARSLQLPQRKLRFLRAEAFESGAHMRRAGEPRHFFLQRGIRIGSCHLRD